MPMDGIALRFTADELNRKLAGGRVEKIIQPERDEIDITIRSGGENHILLLSASSGCTRAHITTERKTGPLEPPMFLQLLRKHLLGGRFVSVAQKNADRILVFTFEHNDELGELTRKHLYFECMGRNSNLIFVNANGKIIDAARHVTELVCGFRDVLPGCAYIDAPEHGKLPFDALDPGALQAALTEKSGAVAAVIGREISGLSKQTAMEIAYRIAGNTDARTEDFEPDRLAAAVCDAVNAILSDFSPHFYLSENTDPVDVCPFEYRSYANLRYEETNSLSEAFDAYYLAKDRRERILQKAASIQRVLKTNIERCEKKLAIQLEALNSAERMDEYRIKGELLTAGLDRAKKGMKQVSLINYYEEDCPEITVELDEKLSPRANAQHYFKLYQKARSARVLASEQKVKTEEELDYLRGQADNLSKCEFEPELNEIREELTKLKYIRTTQNRRQMKALPPSRPFRFNAPDGTLILVGKNNLQNEKLTFSADPMEYWLHAKDMPGSHVIVVSTDPSEETLYYAARLAAGYSSGCRSPKVAVDYTRRKYVKKPSGGRPGFVTFTNQKTVLAEPLRPASE